MRAQQEAVALWQFIESRGRRPTHRAIATMLRSWGLRFTDRDLVCWLTPFRATAAQQIETGAQHKMSTNATSAQHSATPPPLLRVRGKGISSLNKPATQATTSRRHSQLRLVSDEENTAREILATLAPVVKPHLRGKTITEWRKQNKRYALDMAQAGVTVEDALTAHAAASERMGEAVVWLKIVQDQIGRTPQTKPDDGIRRI